MPAQKKPTEGQEMLEYLVAGNFEADNYNAQVLPEAEHDQWWFKPPKGL